MNSGVLFLFFFSLVVLVPFVLASCPIPSTSPPVSDPVGSSWSIPALVYGNTYAGKTCKHFGATPVSNTSTASSVNAYQWGNEMLIWMSPTITTELLGYQTNTISFNLSAATTNRWSGSSKTPANMLFTIDVVALENIGATNEWEISWSGSNVWTKGNVCNACRVLSKQTTTSYLNVNKLYSFDWVQTDPIKNLTLVIRISSGFTPSTANNKYTVSALTLTRKQKNRSFSNLLTVPSGHIAAIKEMPVLSAGNFTQQTNCPHLQSGLKLWHDASTWPGGVIPQPNGNAFSIPASTKVLIDSCTFASGYPTTPYGTITIPTTSQLIIGEGVQKLLVTNIIVKGKMFIGSATCRLKSKLTITFHNSAVDTGGVCGRKTLCVQSPGQLDIHGKLYDATWSRLAMSVLPGDDRFVMQSTANWEVGQQIVLTSTAWKNDAIDYYEVRTIKAIEGKKVRVTAPFSRYHWAGPEYQAEAILLDRRVVLQGDTTSEGISFGGHVIAASKGAQMRIQGTKGYRMGQLNQLARYPFHFHLLGAATNSYIKDCSVHHSYYRCYTIHGTNNTKLSRNTAFDNFGHCYYIEDGVEENNVLEYNIAAYQKPITEVPGVPTNFAASGGSQSGITVVGNSNLKIPADIAAGGFYVTNAYNTFLGNAANGGFAGFSFVNLPAAIGSHRGVTGLLSPQTRPLKSFSGNSIHSTAWQWHSTGCVYIGGKLWYDSESAQELTYNVGRNARNTQLSNGTAVWFRLTNLQVGNCNMGLNHWGDRLELVNFEASDTQRSAQIFGTSWMDNAVINANTGNPTLSKPRNAPWVQLESFQYYDTWSQAIITRVTFKNLQSPTDWGITAVEYSDVFKPQGIAAAKGIKWINSKKELWIHHQTNPVGSSRYFNILDYDNTVANGTTRVRTLIGADDSERYVPGNSGSQLISGWWKIRNDCVSGPTAWNVTICPVADWRYQVGSLSIYVTGYIDGAQYPSTEYAGTMTRWGTSAKTIVTRNVGVTGPIGPKIGWFMWLQKGTPSKFSINTFNIPYVDGKGYTSLPFAVSYPTGLSASYFTVEIIDMWAQQHGYTGINCTKATSLTEVLNSAQGTKFWYDPSSGYLYLKLVSNYNPQGWGGKPENFIRGGATLFDRCNSAYYITLKQCPGCTVLSTSGGISYYQPATTAPPSDASLPA